MKKIKTFYKTPISVFLTLLLFSGCDSWKTDLKADIDQESKDYCLFAPGSYWVYQDSATLEIDSTVIVDISYKESTFAKPTRPFLFEEYIMNIQYFFKNAIKYNGEHILTSKYCDGYKVEAGTNEPIFLLSTEGIDEHYIKVASSFFKYSKNSCSDNFLYFENYQIGENVFSKVKVFTYSFSDNPYQIKTYWAKHVGIIRTEYIGEDFYAVRNLIKYDVNPYN